MIGMLTGFAFAFGIMSPVVAWITPDWKWWRVWFYLGVVLFGALSVLIARESDDGSLGYALGLGIVLMMAVPAALCFLVSFGIKAVALQDRSQSSTTSSRL